MHSISQNIFWITLEAIWMTLETHQCSNSTINHINWKILCWYWHNKTNNPVFYSLPYNSLQFKSCSMISARIRTNLPFTVGIMVSFVLYHFRFTVGLDTARLNFSVEFLLAHPLLTIKIVSQETRFFLAKRFYLSWIKNMIIIAFIQMDTFPLIWIQWLHTKPTIMDLMRSFSWRLKLKIH